MSRKTSSFSYFSRLAIVLALASCVPKNGPQSASAPVVPGAPPLQGTSDQGGGGNLINGKPVDFYREDITLWPEYKKYIEPIDKKFSAIAFPDNSVSILNYVARSKTWYLLPIKLDKLPKERIGTAFGTLQGAIQTRKEIFLSDPELPKLECKEKVKCPRDERMVAQLILHELVMALYRLRFEPAVYFCEWQTDTKIKADCLSGFAAGSTDNSFKPIEQAEFLTSDQYEPIRHFTSWLWENFQKMDRTELWTKLTEKSFDPRIYNQATLNTVNNPESPQKVNLTRDQILQRLKVQASKGTLPSNCGYEGDFPMQSRVKCQIEFQFENDSLQLRIVAEEETFNYSFQVPAEPGVPEKAYQLYKQVFRDGQAFYQLQLRSGFGLEKEKDETLYIYVRDPELTDFEIEAIALIRNIWVLDKKTEFSRESHGEIVPLTGKEKNLELIGKSSTYRIHRREILK